MKPQLDPPKLAIQHSFPQDLEVIFNQISKDDQLLEYDEFQEALVERLQINLSEAEIERVWQRLVLEAKGDLDPRLTARVDFQTFQRGVQNISFLRNIASHLRSGAGAFAVPENYDFAKSTNDNYGVPDRASFHGRYDHIRKTLDYDYHVNYTKARQLWQDHAIQTVVARTRPNGSPWIVYTCGPMGAGKGFVLSWMSRNGYFPLEDIVCIDPDHFKRMMPEWREYTRSGSEAGDLCHRESGFLQEIAQEVAMRSSQNVWIDGSLRDGPWFASVFKKNQI